MALTFAPTPITPTKLWDAAMIVRYTVNADPLQQPELVMSVLVQRHENGAVVEQETLDDVRVSGQPLLAMQADAANRLTANLALPLAPELAYYRATRDAMYSALQSLGVLPTL